jgi:transposase
MVDWAQFCRETMLVYMGCSEKIGGPNKTVETDESKLGRRKYHRGYPVKGQWVSGGGECESGKTFLVHFPDRTADTLTAVIDAWIEHGPTVISDCWRAYRDLDAQGYTHHTVNHSSGFADQGPDAHTNTIESTWRHAKAFLSLYNRKRGLHLPSCSLHVRGEVQG